jgi:monoterpene epsilon-lactone hydrolase
MNPLNRLCFILLLACANAMAADTAGTVHIDSAAIPYSVLASDEARTKFSSMLANPSAPPPGSSILQQRKFYDAFNLDLARRMQKRYAVAISADRIAGVPVDVVTPAEGIAARNESRVLINLHGGAFMWGAHDGGLVEAIPIASVARIKVITVDYREAPENKFPAASEDVAAVYAALLKRYPAKNIGIYGCSAGGILTAESVAWVVTHALPKPGAIGTFCGSLLDTHGDSAYLGAPLTGQPFSDDPLSAKSLPYFSGADLKDPMVIPGASPTLLQQFPPTLLITGSRDFAMSAVIRSHALLVDANVEAELHVYEGMWHAFLIYPELPESQATYRVIAHFFDKHLGV